MFKNTKLKIIEEVDPNNDECEKKCKIYGINSGKCEKLNPSDKILTCKCGELDRVPNYGTFDNLNDPGFSYFKTLDKKQNKKNENDVLD